MHINNLVYVLQEYGKCPICHRTLFENANYVFINDIFIHQCKCGWHIQIKEINGKLRKTK